jgi:hypothetical protein
MVQHAVKTRLPQHRTRSFWPLGTPEASIVLCLAHRQAMVLW